MRLESAGPAPSVHFDNNAFAKVQCVSLAGTTGAHSGRLAAGMPRDAWRAFGRLTHTAQDFYSHSNYVDLWMACHPPGRLPARLNRSTPLDEDLVNSPALRSGRPYLPLGC